MRGALAAWAAPPVSRTAAKRADAARNARRKPALTAVRILSTCLARARARGHTGRGLCLMRSLRVAAVLLAAFPATARAGDHATIHMQEAPVGATRTTAAAVAPGRFDLVGLHWEGPGMVFFRTR